MFFVFFLLCHSDDVAEKKGQRRILSSDEDARKIKQGLIFDIPPRGMKTKSLWETRERENGSVEKTDELSHQRWIFRQWTERSPANKLLLRCSYGACFFIASKEMNGLFFTLNLIDERDYKSNGKGRLATNL